MPEELGTEVHDIVQEAVIKTIPKKMKGRKAKWLSKEALQTAEKRREAKGKGTRDQIANICWIIGKAKEFQKNTYLWPHDYAKAFDCVDHNKLWEILRDRNTKPPHLPPEKPVCKSRSNS